MLNLHQKVEPHPEVVDTELDDEVVLLHLEKKLYYSLNATGARIWVGLKRGLTLEEITQDLQEQYEIEPEHAARSVAELVEDLQRQKLVRFPTDSDQ